MSSSTALSGSDDCPCGAGKLFSECCERYLTGAAEAPTAEALMRSRYCAYLLRERDYMERTWHPSTCPPGLDADAGADVEWLGLEVIGVNGGGEGDRHGEVEFVARYRHAGGEALLRERSHFVRQEGRWFYLNGHEPPQRRELPKVGRNDPCPCGSGRKFKKCCGAG